MSNTSIRRFLQPIFSKYWGTISNDLRVARNWQADVIVIDRRGISELLMGSVSNYVLHHAQCSVFTVQGVASYEEKVDRKKIQIVSI